MKSVTIDVSKDGVCMLGGVDGKVSPGLAYAILEDYQSAINPGMSVLGVLPRGQDGKSAPYGVYSWEELGDLALEHADLVRVRVVGPGARQPPNWLEIIADIVAEAASAPGIRAGRRDDLDVQDDAFDRYVCTAIGGAWLDGDPLSSIAEIAGVMVSAADDLMSAGCALQELARTHKAWMRGAGEASDEG